MCISVHRSPTVNDMWDAEARTITIPTQLDDAHAAAAVRATLNELGVEQPHIGALCWCGDPIQAVPRIPEQRHHSEVMPRGA